jgi:hypothetical protein
MEATEQQVTEVTASPVEQQQAVETQPVEPKLEGTEKKETLSSQFAALAKKEKRILSKQQELEAKNKDLEEKLKKYEQFEAKKQAARTNPLEYLSEAGLTYDELTQYILNGSKALEKDKATEIEERLNSFIAQAEADKKSQAEREAKLAQEQEEKVIAQFKESVKSHINNKKSDYELINLYDATELVISTIEAHFEKTQQILDTDSAAELVEKHLEDEIKKLANSNKFKDKFKIDEPKANPVARKDSVTLNSSMPASSVPSSLPAHSEADRIKRALAALG